MARAALPLPDLAGQQVCSPFFENPDRALVFELATLPDGGLLLLLRETCGHCEEGGEHHMKNLFLAVLITFATVLTCSTSDAKPISKILSESGLSPEDFTIMNDQTATLYTNVTPRKGALIQWKNDATRSYGLAELVSVQENCVYLRHLVHPKGIQTAREIRMRRCKNSDGVWILE